MDIGALSRRAILTAAAASGFALAANGSVASADELNRPGKARRPKKVRPAKITGTVLYVSSLNPSPANSTSALQSALDSTYDTIVIDKIPGNYTTGPLNLTRGDVTIMVEPGVMLRALPGAYPNLRDVMLHIQDQSNVTISGYGATMAMNKKEYTTGQWRHTIRLGSVTDVTIEGLTLRDTGGDAISMGNGLLSETPSINVTLRDLTCDNLRRNGLSVGTADGLVVEGCLFRGAEGNNPEACIDFEPDKPSMKLANITVRDCYLESSLSYGLLVALNYLDSTSAPVSITLDRCTVSGPINKNPTVTVSVVPDGTSGNVTVKDSLIIAGPSSSLVGMWKKSALGVGITFDRSTFWSWGSSTYRYSPMTFASGFLDGAGTVPQYGGVTFTSCSAITDQPGPFLRAYDGNDGAGSFTDVHGQLTVYAPNATGSDFGSSPTNVDLVITPTTATAANVGVTLSSTTVTGGNQVTATWVRTGGDLTKPLSVQFQTGGTARERYDYSGLGKVITFPAGSTSVVSYVQTYARHDSADPTSRSLAVHVAPGQGYLPSTDVRTVRIDG